MFNVKKMSKWLVDITITDKWFWKKSVYYDFTRLKETRANEKLAREEQLKIKRLEREKQIEEMTQLLIGKLWEEVFKENLEEKLNRNKNQNKSVNGGSNKLDMLSSQEWINEWGNSLSINEDIIHIPIIKIN